MSGLLSSFSTVSATAEPVSMACSRTCAAHSDYRALRCDCRRPGCWDAKKVIEWNGMKRKKCVFAQHAQISASACPLSSNQEKKKNTPCSKIYQEVLEAAREKFTQEISFLSKDKDISLAKILLYVAAEDEAFMAINRQVDSQSLSNERRSMMSPPDPLEWDRLEEMPLAGKNISQWMSELDLIAKEVEAELIPRDIGCHLAEVLEAVNLVLFRVRGFKRASIPIDPKCSYLHSVLSFRNGSAILVSIIYIEVCRRLGLDIVGSRVGEDFLIWPRMVNPEELFKVTSGPSLFAVVNGSCVENPKSRASELTGTALLGLDIASKRDIVGIALANLIRLYWKRASRLAHGLMLTSPLRNFSSPFENLSKHGGSNTPLLRPRDLRLAIMASERLLILQPHDWALRRDLGMMLYFNREYVEAVQELSICMVFAPEEESEILEPFVEKLHLLRLESTWKSFGYSDQLTIP